MGITGVRNLAPDREPTTIEHIVDHIDHVVKLVGIEHVGIGSDSDLQRLRRHAGRPAQGVDGVGTSRATRSATSSTRTASTIRKKVFDLTEALIRRGYGDSNIEAVLGGNFRRLLGTHLGLSANRPPKGNMHMGTQSRRAAPDDSDCIAMILAVAAATQAQEAAPGQIPCLGEIVVTAQKRTENISTCRSRSASWTGRRPSKAAPHSSPDYSAYVPGMQVDSNGTPGQTTVSLRGIGPLGSSATVGTYIDDGPISSSGIYNSTNALSFELMPNQHRTRRSPAWTAGHALRRQLNRRPPQVRDRRACPRRIRGQVGVEAVDVTDGSGNDFNYGARISFPLVKDSLGMSLSYAQRELPAYIDNIQTGEADVNEGTQEGARVASSGNRRRPRHVSLSAMRQEVDSDDNAMLYEDINGVPIGDGLQPTCFSTSPIPANTTVSATLNLQIGEIDPDFRNLLERSRHARDSGCHACLRRAHRRRDPPGRPSAFGRRLHVRSGKAQDAGNPARLARQRPLRVGWLGAFYTDEDNEVEQMVSLYDPVTGA